MVSELLDKALRIVVYGIISFVILVIVLMKLGVLKSPAFEDLMITWLITLTVEMIKVESRLWKEISEFKGEVREFMGKVKQKLAIK
ncbi:MAG: hypothetical protein QW156_01910 [Candidatus Aenigmatarchaeota archaeon]